MLLHADSGNHLTMVDLGERFERRYGHAYAVMHRGDLLAVLHQACLADGRIRKATAKSPSSPITAGRLGSASRTAGATSVAR